MKTRDCPGLGRGGWEGGACGYKKGDKSGPSDGIILCLNCTSGWKKFCGIKLCKTKYAHAQKWVACTTGETCIGLIDCLNVSLLAVMSFSGYIVVNHWRKPCKGFRGISLYCFSQQHVDWQLPQNKKIKKSVSVCAQHRGRHSEEVPGAWSTSSLHTRPLFFTVPGASKEEAGGEAEGRVFFNKFSGGQVEGGTWGKNQSWL